MKRWVFSVIVLLSAGCSTVEPVKNIIRDREFTDYKGTLDQLEHDYLKKRISYAEYLEKKKRVEEEYQQAVDNRRDLIENKDVKSVTSELNK